MVSKALFSSNTNEWATPRAFFAALNAEFHFDLDPCATPQNAKCKKFYTIENDGLTKDWGGQEFSATLHTAETSESGSRNATRNPASQTRWS